MFFLNTILVKVIQKKYLKPFIVKSGVGNQNKKASLMLLLKEATNKDIQLKTQLPMSFTGDDSKGSERIWIDSGFFGD